MASFQLQSLMLVSLLQGHLGCPSMALSRCCCPLWLIVPTPNLGRTLVTWTLCWRAMLLTTTLTTQALSHLLTVGLTVLTYI